MTETIEPKPAQIDHEQPAQELVDDRLVRKGIDLVARWTPPHLTSTHSSGHRIPVVLTFITVVGLAML
jgi:hypothetical protein